jgi:hypothetical protein
VEKYLTIMNKLSYKIIAWILIIAGIVYATTNLYFSFGGPTIADRLYELGFGLLSSSMIIALSFFPGKYYLTIGNDGSERNKLTNSSLILTAVGMLLIIVAFFTMLIMCPPPSFCYGWGLMIVFYGIFPAAALYAIAVILLLLNIFKKV